MLTMSRASQGRQNHTVLYSTADPAIQRDVSESLFDVLLTVSVLMYRLFHWR